MNCPPDHKHEVTLTCASTHGCKCGPCVSMHSRYRADARARLKRERRQHRRIRARGTQRRLQALAVMGWSCAVLERECGVHSKHLDLIRRGAHDAIDTRTAAKIYPMYERLKHVQAPAGKSSGITRSYARRHGWAAAAAWDDIDRDEYPAE